MIERAFRAGDAPALAALVEACEGTYRDFLPAGWTPPEISTDWDARLAEDDRWSLLVEDAGAVVGFAAFRPAFDEEEPSTPSGVRLPGVAHVASVFVAPSHWRRGIATSLLARAEEAMRSRGFVRAVLWTPEGSPAESFYRARGWARDGRRAWHHWVGLYVVGYRKTL